MDRTPIVNEPCPRIKIVASKTRAAYAPSEPPFIRAAILTRDVASEGQSGVPVSGSFQHAIGVLLPSSVRRRADPVVLSEGPGTGVGVCAVPHG